MTAFACGFLLLSLDVLLLGLMFRHIWQLGAVKPSKLLALLIFSKMLVLGVGVYFALAVYQQDVLYFTVGALLALGAITLLCIVADKYLYSRRILR